MTTPPGFTIGLALSRLTRNTAFEPLFTGPLLLYSLRLVPQIPDSLLPDIFYKVAPYINRSRAAVILAALFALGLIRKASYLISERSTNNWTSDSYDWDKEIVVITGGSSGLGEYVTKDLCRRRIRLAMIDINPPQYELGGTAKFFKCDLSSADDVAKTCEAIRTTIGDPTVLVNNAGIASGKSLLDTTPLEYHKMFDINTISHFLLVREFLPAMVKNNHGHVITIASMATFMTVAWNVSYSQVKSSALAFHEGLSQELKHIYEAPKVRTSIFHPTWVCTPLIEHVTKMKGWQEPTLKTEEVGGAIVERILSGRSKQVIMPEYLSGASLIRGMPCWMQEVLRDQGAIVGKTIMEEGGFQVPATKYNFS